MDYMITNNSGGALKATTLKSKLQQVHLKSLFLVAATLPFAAIEILFLGTQTMRSQNLTTPELAGVRANIYLRPPPRGLVFASIGPEIGQGTTAGPAAEGIAKSNIGQGTTAGHAEEGIAKQPRRREKYEVLMKKAFILNQNVNQLIPIHSVKVSKAL
ncbi:hypothetical protein FH972_002776 [Carpinus fangiana]|uniref:Uncharacterized protein n=1 Tax=Carpinus fangiana TaxID=176857 RepID=A0A5N6QJB7_9ROSI|nr:hypothetical protein FH972_002776 [Carpinus fangiana]